MNWIAPALGVTAAACGFVGAWYWLKASNTPLLTKGDWSGSAEMNRLSREADMIEQLQKSGQRNAKGARWTAAAAFIASLAALAALL